MTNETAHLVADLLWHAVQGKDSTLGQQGDAVQAKYRSSARTLLQTIAGQHVLNDFGATPDKPVFAIFQGFEGKWYAVRYEGPGQITMLPDKETAPHDTAMQASTTLAVHFADRDATFDHFEVSQTPEQLRTWAAQLTSGFDKSAEVGMLKEAQALPINAGSILRVVQYLQHLESRINDQERTIDDMNRYLSQS